MAGLVTVSRVYPTYGFLDLPNSGKPEFGCHPRLCSKEGVDARNKCGHDEEAKSADLYSR